MIEDLSRYNVNFEGVGGKATTVTLNRFLNGTVPDDDHPAVFWPYLILLLVLVLSSIACFVYSRSKSEKREAKEDIEAEEVYKTMSGKEDLGAATGTQFESGLNPNEEEDGLN